MRYRRSNPFLGCMGGLCGPGQDEPDPSSYGFYTPIRNIPFKPPTTDEPAPAKQPTTEPETGMLMFTCGEKGFIGQEILECVEHYKTYGSYPEKKKTTLPLKKEKTATTKPPPKKVVTPTEPADDPYTEPDTATAPSTATTPDPGDTKTSYTPFILGGIGVAVIAGLFIIPKFLKKGKRKR